MKLQDLFRTLGASVREYKRDSILAPVFITGEVVFECLIPFIMAKMIDHLGGTGMGPVIRYGLLLLILAACSLICGVLSARFAATASTGFAKNLRQDIYFRIQDFAFQDIDQFSVSSLITRMTTDVTNMHHGKYPIDGDKLILQINEITTGPKETKRPEVHRPCCEMNGPEAVKKIVLKVRVDSL